MALELRRFNQRHDTVLGVVAGLVRTHLSPTQKMVVDLPEENYHYPPHIGSTDSRPDIVIWDDILRRVHLLELTVCFETNLDTARQRKLCRYTDLLEEAELKGYHGTLITIEVGSRGVLHTMSLEEVRSLLGVRKKEWTAVLVDISIVESHKKWSSRNWRG